MQSISHQTSFFKFEINGESPGNLVKHEPSRTVTSDRLWCPLNAVSLLCSGLLPRSEESDIYQHLSLQSRPLSLHSASLSLSTNL